MITDLSEFVRLKMPEWPEVRQSIIGASIMFQKKMVDGDFVEQTVLPKVGAMVAKLSTEDLEQLEELLHVEANLNGLVLDAVTACLQMRGKA